MFVGKVNKFLVLTVISSEVTWGQYTEVTNVLVLRKQSMNPSLMVLVCDFYDSVLCSSVTVLLDHCCILVLLDLTAFLCF